MKYRMEIKYELDVLASFEVNQNTSLRDINRAFDFFKETIKKYEANRKMVSVKIIADRESAMSIEIFIGNSEPVQVFEKQADRLKSIIYRDYELISNETHKVVQEDDFKMKKSEKLRAALTKYHALGGKKNICEKTAIGSRTGIVLSNMIFIEKIKQLALPYEELSIKEIAELINYDRSYQSLRNLLNKEKIKFKSQKTRKNK